MFEIDTFSDPFYLFHSSEKCEQCGKTSRVIALASGSSEPFVLTEIREIPETLLTYITTAQPNYGKHYLDGARSLFYVNTCPCGAYFSDFELYCEPCGAFFPTEKNEAAQIEVIELPIQGEHTIECSPGMGTGGQILEHGKRINWDSLS
jgi:hypothetical protein